MAEENDTGTEEETTEEETSTEEETTTPPVYTPPSEEDWKKSQAALKRAQGEAKKLRLAAKDATKPEEKTKDDVKDQAAQSDMRVKRSAGIAALTEAGLNRQQAKVAVRLLDLDAAQVDDDGDVDGIDDLVDDLKEAFPGMFAKDSGNGRRAPRVTTADRGSGGDRSSSAQQTEKRIDDRLLKQAGYR